LFIDATNEFVVTTNKVSRYSSTGSAAKSRGNFLVGLTRVAHGKVEITVAIMVAPGDTGGVVRFGQRPGGAGRQPTADAP
jgi:hypothetical protein